MKTTIAILSGLVCLLNFTSPAAENVAATGTPVIQFENTFFDFGKIVALGKVSGSFKFKNAGDGTLKLDPPRPSCGCTDAKLTSDTLAPGQSGEITYTINLDHPTGQVQKHISIYSNDPKSPDVELTMQLDCTPLYELSRKMVRLVLPPGQDDVQTTVTISRNDGKPSAITRLISNQGAVTAQLEDAAATEPNVKTVKVNLHRPSAPTPKIVSNIQFFTSDDTNHPMETLIAWCDIQGELSVKPSQMYWVVPNLGSSITNYPPEALTHKMQLTSTLNEPVTIKSVTTNIKGMTAQAVPKDDGKTFDLVLKFEELPHQLMNGNVIVETASTTLPKLEVPVTVAAAE